MPNKTANAEANMPGFDKSTPAAFTKASKAEPVNVKAKLTKNWMKSLLSLPNISVDIKADKRNIHANPKMKTAKSVSELIHAATKGTEPPNEEATVVKAVLVKIW